MKTEPVNPQQSPRFLRFIVEKILPRALQQDYARGLNERHTSFWKFVPESAATVAAGYAIQAVDAFNKTAFVVEIGIVIFCFAAASLPLPLFIVLGAVLGALTLRDAYTHPHRGSDVREKQRPGSQYYVDMAGDAVTAAVFLFASQALMLEVSPSLAVPGRAFLRGALVCLPLLSICRMLLRPRPDPTTRSKGSNMSAEAIYKMTWRLNILWMTACFFTLLASPDAIPALIPGRDFLIGFIPPVTFGLWIRLPYDVLSHGDRIEGTFGDHKKKEKARKKESLMKGVDKSNPLYPAYAVMEALFFLLLAIPVAIALWQWLSGRQTEMDFLRLASHAVVFGTLVLSWKYVKNSNRTAALALQEEIEGPATETSV